MVNPQPRATKRARGSPKRNGHPYRDDDDPCASSRRTLQLHHLFLVGLQELGRPSFRRGHVTPTLAVAAERVQILLPRHMLA